MKKLLFILFVLIGINSIAQTYRYNPSLGTTSNKSYALGQAGPVDSREWLYDSLNFRMRPYVSKAEVLHYLYLPKFRTGNFSIWINEGGSLSNGVVTGGRNLEYWFRDNCTADSCLVLKYDTSSVVPSGSSRYIETSTIDSLRLFNVDTLHTYRLISQGDVAEFYYDPNDEVSPDDSVMVLVGENDKRLKRYFNGVIYPEWWGAKGDNITNDGPAWNRMFRWMESQAYGTYEVKFKNIKYYTSETIFLPRYMQTVAEQPNVFLKISAAGRSVRTDQDIDVFSRMPNDDAEVSLLNNNHKLLLDGLFVCGDRSTVGQTGMRIACYYGAEFTNMQFSGLDTGVVGHFLTKSNFRNIFFTSNLSVDLILKSLYQIVGNQDIAGSATNITGIEDCRFFKAPNSYAALMLFGTDNTTYTGKNVIEGSKPRYGYYSDYMGSTLSNTQLIDNLWFEGTGGSPSVNFRIIGAGLTRINNVQRTYADTLFDFTGSQANAQFEFDGFTYGGNLSAQPFNVGTVDPSFSGRSIKFKNVDLATADLVKDPTKWVGGQVPINMLLEYHQGANNGYTITSGGAMWLLPGIRAADAFNRYLYVNSNFQWATDNSGSIGGWYGGADGRPRAGHFGTTGVIVDNSGRFQFGRIGYTTPDLTLARDSIGQLSILDNSSNYKNIKAARGIFTQRTGYNSAFSLADLGDNDFITKSSSRTVIYKDYPELRAMTISADTSIFYDDKNGNQFKYDPSDVSSSDDSAMVIVSGAKRLKRVTNGIVYVRWFGATPNDFSDDDAPSFNKMFSYIKSQGNKIYKAVIDEGRYQVNSRIFLPDSNINVATHTNIIIEGYSSAIFLNSSNASIFYRPYASQATVENYYLPGYSFIIRGIKFFGDGSNVMSGQKAIDVCGTYSMVIEDCHFQYFDTAIVSRFSLNPTIQNNWFQGNRKVCVYGGTGVGLMSGATICNSGFNVSFIHKNRFNNYNGSFAAVMLDNPIGANVDDNISEGNHPKNTIWITGKESNCQTVNTISKLWVESGGGANLKTTVVYSESRNNLYVRDVDVQTTEAYLLDCRNADLDTKTHRYVFDGIRSSGIDTAFLVGSSASNTSFEINNITLGQSVYDYFYTPSVWGGAIPYNVTVDGYSINSGEEGRLIGASQGIKIKTGQQSGISGAGILEVQGRIYHHVDNVAQDGGFYGVLDKRPNAIYAGTFGVMVDQTGRYRFGLPSNPASIDLSLVRDASGRLGVMDATSGYADIKAKDLTLTGVSTGTNTDSVIVINNGLLKKVLQSSIGGSYTFSTGLTNTSGTVTNDLSTGVSGGQTLIGSTSTNSGITYKATSGVGTTGADHIFTVGNNGATEGARITNDGNIGVGTGSTVSAKAHIVGTTEQLRVGYNASNYMSATVSSGGVPTWTTTSGFFGINAITTLGTDVGNLWVPAGSNALGSTTRSEYQLSGSSTMYTRVGIRGNTGGTLAANTSYSSLTVGVNTMTEATSGTHPLLSQAAFRALSVTAGSATVTDAATVWIEGASNATVSGSNDAFRVASGSSRFGGSVSQTNGTNTWTKSIVGTEQWNGLTVGGSYTLGRAYAIDVLNNFYTGSAANTTYPGYSGGGNLFIGGNQIIAGGSYESSLNITSSQTLGTSICNIYVDAVGGNVTITLPLVSTVRGTGLSSSSIGIVYHIKRVDNSGNTVTISAQSPDLIDYAATKTLTYLQSISIQAAPGNNWYIK